MHSIITAILDQLEQNLTVAATASEQAHASATHSENAAENKYDTLALEAAYLAHGQSVRIQELQQSIHNYQHFVKPEFGPEAKIALGAIVRLLNISSNEVIQVFIAPDAGGLKVTCNNETIQLLSLASPLGKQLIGLTTDDEFTFANGQFTQTYAVLAVN